MKPDPRPDMKRHFRAQNDELTPAHKLLDQYERDVLKGAEPNKELLDQAEDIIKAAGDGLNEDEKCARDYVWARLNYFDGDMDDALDCLAGALNSQSQRENALKLVTKISRDNNPIAELRRFTFRVMGRFHDDGNKEHLAEALDVAELINSIDPDQNTQRNHYLIGSIYKELGNYPQALYHAEIAETHNVEGHRDTVKLAKKMEALVPRDQRVSHTQDHETIVLGS